MISVTCLPLFAVFAVFAVFAASFESITLVLFNHDKHQAKQEPLDDQMVPK